MDDPHQSAAPVARFRPDRRYTLAALTGFVLAAGGAALTGDPEGRLLAVLAAVVLLGYAGCDLVFAPRLEASAAGIVVRAPLTRAVLPWSQVEVVRADTRQRLGLRATTLEVDAGPVLVVLSRRALGADPAEVADLVNAFRPG